MTTESPAVLQFRLEISDAGAEEIDRLTRNLAAELRETDAQRVELVRSEEPPAGAKGEGVSLGAIVVAAIPAFIPLLIEYIRAWVERQRKDDLRFSGTINGHPVDFAGSRKELEILTRSLTRPSSTDPTSPSSKP